MKRKYDFSGAKRGPITPAAKGKPRITIRIDDDILSWLREQVHQSGGGNYQTLVNDALRDCMTRRDGALAETLRRVIREEVSAYVVRPRRK